MPTDLSDVGHVLAWADRHAVEWAAEGDAADAAGAADAAELAAKVSAEAVGEARRGPETQTRDTTAIRWDALTSPLPEP